MVSIVTNLLSMHAKTDRVVVLALLVSMWRTAALTLETSVICSSNMVISDFVFVPSTMASRRQRCFYIECRSRQPR